jgi:hypothetical protein
MHSRWMRGVVAAALVLTVASPPAMAQLSDNLGALSGDNAKGYLAPLTSGLSGTLNTAIFSGASIPLAGLQFNIGVRLMGIEFDDDDRLYSPTDPPGFDGDAAIQAPTVIGDGQAVAQPGQGGTTLFHPGGFDLHNFAVAVPQLTVGSVLGTRATVRFISLDLGDTELGDFTLWGIGAQHSISRYLPALPVNLAADVFYQKFDIGEDDLITASALHFGVTASKRLGLFEPYAAVGYDQLDMEAEYTFEGTGEKITVDFDSESNGHLTLGSTLSLAIVKLYGELNFAAETGMAVGLSFGI